MSQKVLFVQPPFTQLNTPYPATAYLKGFLNTQDIESQQADIAIETILALFSRKGLSSLFELVEKVDAEFSSNVHRILSLKPRYLKTIDDTIGFLQGQQPTLANSICTRNYLPEASRFSEMADLEWAFGSIGIHDKARHLATLYLEDLSDFIVETIDPNFGFSRYAEHLGRSARYFDELYDELHSGIGFIDNIYLDLLEQKIRDVNPTVIAFSVPFPGNLYAAFKCAQQVKTYHPDMTTVLGGGFPNTELRSLEDHRVFEFFDFVTLDDGEAPLLNLIEHLDGSRAKDELKRCFALIDGEVRYFNNSKTADFKQRDVGTPDYSGLPLKKYLSVIEVANPMHRLWSDGRWNKLTLAHGCYWGKCTFCDISLDYIKIYEATTAKMLVDRMEELVEQTGESGFHFVDEAAPPALMRELALEIIKRDLSVTWWTNIRFEKSFTTDLCRLLAASGCIAVSGGLEVASDRLLELIDKGVTVAQVSRVARDFTEVGIMVHAYLMYGYPTQTVQETVDSLEVVRQLYELGVVQSGFWHQFAMTTHSPVGMHPEKFQVEILDAAQGTFANNDLEFTDPTGIDHQMFSDGLKASLFNYMHGLCFEYELQEWFDFPIPPTSLPADYIETFLTARLENDLKPNKKAVWLGMTPILEDWEDGTAKLYLVNQNDEMEVRLKKPLATWISQQLCEVGKTPKSLAHLKSDFEQKSLGNFEKFWRSSTLTQLREFGLLFV